MWVIFVFFQILDFIALYTYYYLSQIIHIKKIRFRNFFLHFRSLIERARFFAHYTDSLSGNNLNTILISWFVDWKWEDTRCYLLLQLMLWFGWEEKFIDTSGTCTNMLKSLFNCFKIVQKVFSEYFSFSSVKHFVLITRKMFYKWCVLFEWPLKKPWSCSIFNVHDSRIKV